jgi:hypothetical protein
MKCERNIAYKWFHTTFFTKHFSLIRMVFKNVTYCTSIAVKILKHKINIEYFNGLCVVFEF